MSTTSSPGPPRRPAAAGLADKLARAGPRGISTWLLGLIALVAVLTALHIARSVLIPLTVAVLLQFLFAPLVERLRRLGAPAPLAAGALLIGFLGVAGLGVYHLSGPALDWAEELQAGFGELEWKLAGIKEPLEGMARASRRVEEMAAVGEDDVSVVRVRQETENPLRGLLLGALEVTFAILFTAFLLFFLLARDRALLRKLPVLMRDPASQERFRELFHVIERDVSKYLLTITAINAVLGLAVGTAMYLYGLPNPVLWGVMACFFNFVPYLGGLVGITTIAVVSLVSDQVTVSPLLPALTYAALNGLEGMLFTPMILGRTLTLSPVAVFIWLILWSWLWGVPGALLAVPLLAVLKIICDQMPPLRTAARLLDR